LGGAEVGKALLGVNHQQGGTGEVDGGHSFRSRRPGESATFLRSPSSSFWKRLSSIPPYRSSKSALDSPSTSPLGGGQKSAARKPFSRGASRSGFSITREARAMPARS